MASSKHSQPAQRKRPEPTAAKPFRTCDILAELYGRDVLRIIGQNEFHALTLFRRLRDVRPEFPDDIFKWYDMLNAMRMEKKIRVRREALENGGLMTVRLFISRS